MRYVDDLGPPPPEFDDGGMIALALLILLAFCLAMAIAGCSFSLVTLRYEQCEPKTAEARTAAQCEPKRDTIPPEVNL